MINDLVKRLRDIANELEQFDSNVAMLFAGSIKSRYVSKSAREQKTNKTKAISAMNANELKQRIHEINREKEQKAEKSITRKMNTIIADGINDIVKDNPPITKTSLKGYKYKPGSHWTQKPENKKKLAKVVRQMVTTKKVKNV